MRGSLAVMPCLEYARRIQLPIAYDNVLDDPLKANLIKFVITAFAWSREST